MTPLTLLRSLGLSLRLEGKRLMVAPPERIDQDARDYIRLHRQEIIDELASVESDRWYAVSKEIWE